VTRPRDYRPPIAIFPVDFLAGEHTGVMRPEQRGAYMNLLCFVWPMLLEGRGGLENDLAILARLAGFPDRAYFEARVWPALAPCFVLVDGRLVPPALERQCRQYAKLQKAGRLGAFKRWRQAAGLE